MTISQKIWLALRFLVVAGVSLEIYFLPPTTSNLDWIACGLISSAGGVGIFLWLMSIRNRATIDWSETFSLTKPFFPMNQNPVRFWLVAAVSLTVGGMAAFLEDVALGGQHAAFGATFLFLGIAILVAITAWRKVCRLERIK